MTWAETLPAINLEQLRPIFPESDQARDAAVGLDQERTHRRHGRHTTKDARKASHAAEVLDRLPEPGESIHTVMAASFDAWDFVPAVLKLAAPATIARLTIATLGYNRRGMDELLSMLDRGDVGTATVLASVYFRAHEATLWGWLASELTARGCRLLAARNHAKLLLFEMTDGDHYVMESSANLRSCRMAEQATITADEALYDFHVAWIHDLFERAKK